MRLSNRWWLAVATCTLAVPAFAAGDAPLRLQQETEMGGGEEETQVGEQVVIQTDEVEVQTEEVQTDRGGMDTGLYALVGGGAEMYTGSLSDRLKVGPSAGVAVGLKGPLIGFEAAYNGGGLEAESNLREGLDVLRSGGQLAATVQLTQTAIQPFLLGGGGYDWYNVQDEDTTDATGAVSGFKDAGSFYIPAGVGVRYQAGPLITVDVRGTYNFTLNEDFLGDVSGDRLQGLATLGGTF
jgi:hypothetical protein